MHCFEVSIVPVDGLVPLGARSSAGTGMTKSRLCEYMRLRVNSLGPSDAISRHISGLTLAQVMACCLTAPSHYLNQCWPIISHVLWHPLQGNFTMKLNIAITDMPLKNYYFNITAISPRGQWVKFSVDCSTDVQTWHISIICILSICNI